MPDYSGMTADQVIDSITHDPALSSKLSLRPLPIKATYAILPGGSSYVTKTLLTKTANVGGKIVNSGHFPLDMGAYFFQTLSAEVRVQFAAIDSSAANADILDYFLGKTDVLVKLDGTDIVSIPLSRLVPFTHGLVGTTWTFVPRHNFVAYKMGQQIIVPPGETLELVVTPPSGLVTPTSAATCPHILDPAAIAAGLATAEGRACFVEFNLNGIQMRKASSSK